MQAARKEAILFAERHKTTILEASGPCVTIGSAADLSPAEKAELERHICEFVPWRKGPFSLFGRRVAAHWKSDLRWARVSAVAGNLAGQKIADVGCNNGYYMFRMLGAGAAHVTGFDPVDDCADTFAFLAGFQNEERLAFIQRGYDALYAMPESFDAIFCMGILYHQRNPLDVILAVRSALRPGGTAVFESIVIDDPGPALLFPPGRYAGMKGVWFVPSPDALRSWIVRSGFADAVIQDVYRYEGEQSSTRDGPMPGLLDFVDARDPSKTVEGLPVPLRAIVTARR